MHILTFGGGTNEMQRDLIALFGLSMPVSRASEEHDGLLPHRRAAGADRAGGADPRRPVPAGAPEGGRAERGLVRPALWAELAKADLLGIALPEASAAAAAASSSSACCSQEQGRRVAPLPLLPTLARRRSPIARFGTRAQQAAHLRRRGDGTAAARRWRSTEPGADPRAPLTTATPDGDGWRLDRRQERRADRARRRGGDRSPRARARGGSSWRSSTRSATGVRLERQETMNHEPQFRVQLDGVRVGADAVLGIRRRGAEVLDWIVDRATVGLCAIASGACAGGAAPHGRVHVEAQAVRQADRHVPGGRPAHGRLLHRPAGDERSPCCRRRRSWRTSCRRPRRSRPAKYWAAEGGSRIGHAALHVHGGISIDLDYPIHRYFLWLKPIEFTLGAATPQLVRLGASIATG